MRTPALLGKNDATVRLQSLQWRVIFAEGGMCPNVPNVLPCCADRGLIWTLVLFDEMTPTVKLQVTYVSRHFFEKDKC